MTDLSTTTTPDFGELVAADVRETITEEERKYLRSLDRAEQWYDTLNALHRSLDAQLTAKRSELKQKKLELSPAAFEAFEASVEMWRAKTLRFKTGVENRLAEARALRASNRSVGYTEILLRERTKAVREVLNLRALILAHRDHVCGDDCGDECQADLALWAVLHHDPDL